MDWPTTVVFTILAAIVLLIVGCGIRNKKRGKRTCSSCKGCLFSDTCHTRKDK